MTNYSVFNTWHDDIVILATDTGEDEMFIPARSIVSWSVDWNTANGRLRILVAGAARPHVVTFNENDHGEECAEALSTLAQMLTTTSLETT